MISKEEYKERIVAYTKHTIKNKLVALALFALGYASVALTNDFTFMLFVFLVGIPLLIAKKNYIS